MRDTPHVITPAIYARPRVSGMSKRVTVVLGAVLLGFALPAAAMVAASIARFVDVQADTWPGMDLEIMRELGHRWLDTGSMYLPYQLAGPYSTDVVVPLTGTPGLYPPVAGPIFGVLSMIPWPIAAVAWWGVPFAIMAYACWRWRPSLLAWAGMTFMCCFAMTWLVLFVGGTTMWASALVAAGLLWGWPAALILVKPILLPFALVGARRRSWWVAVAVVGVVTLLGPWRDYIAVVRNASDVSYVTLQVPLMLIPLIAWLGRRPVAPDGDVEDVLGREGALLPDELESRLVV